MPSVDLPPAFKTERSDRGGSVLPRLRPELVATEQVYDGRPYWVVKDPVSLRYFRFSREEHFLMEQLRQPVTLEQVLEAYRRQFRDDTLTGGDVSEFISNLLSRNLLLMPHARRDEMLYRAGRKRWRARLLAQVSNFMFFKLPLYDPDRLLGRMLPRLRFLWSRGFLAVYLGLLGLAGVLLLRRWGDFVSMFQGDFFTLRNLPLLFVVMWVIKVFHELGHGFTCKQYGGEVHELGLLFLVFTPFLYCNVTDSWTFRSKHRRVLVAAGGILTELLFAALAAIAWFFTEQPGFVHALMFNVMLGCSISTILFNANPLLKYDGYYMLMDVLEAPNLRQRSGDYVRDLFISGVLGGRADRRSEQHRFRFLFPLYSCAAYCYRWFILFVILYFVYRVLEQLRLLWLGRFVAVLGAATMLVAPLARGAARLVSRRRELALSSTRLVLLLALLAAGAAVALFWPYEQSVMIHFVLEPARVTWIRCDADGQLRWTEGVREGAWLEPQQSRPVATLENHQLHLEYEQLRARIEQLDLEIDQHRPSPAANSLVQQLRQRRDTLARQQQRLEERLAALQVRAPFAGEVLTADRDLRLAQEKYCTRGEPLLLLGDTRRLVAKVWVPEKTWARIFAPGRPLGQHAELLLYTFPRDRFPGQVVAVSRHTEDSMGIFEEKLALSNKVGGEVLTEYDPATRHERPIEAVYEVTIALAQGSVPTEARSYMSGRARLDCGKSTLYQWTRDSLLRFISPEVRL